MYLLIMLGSLLCSVYVGLSSYRWLIQHALGMYHVSRYKYGYIYVFKGKRESWLHLKIGRSNNAVHRLQQHQTANPYGVYVLAVMKVRDDVWAEKYLHKRFSRLRVRGGEWFLTTPGLLFYIMLARDFKLTKQVRSKLH